MPYFKIVALLFMLLFPNGCVGTDSHSKEKPTVKVRLLYKGDQCQTKRSGPQAFWIDDPDQFKKTCARLTRHTIGAQQDHALDQDHHHPPCHLLGGELDAAVDDILADPSGNAEAARAIAEGYFDGAELVRRMLETDPG